MSDPLSNHALDNPKLLVLLLRAEDGDWRRDRRIREALGLPPERPDGVEHLRGRYGKPILPRCTFSQPRRYFNISHCSGWLALAQSRIGQVGIDVETLDPNLDLSLTATSRCLNSNERRWLAAKPVAERPGGFLLLWTRKEAILKAIGSGIACSLARVNSLQQVVRGWRLRSFVTRDVVLSIAMRDRLFDDGAVGIDGDRNISEVAP